MIADCGAESKISSFIRDTLNRVEGIRLSAGPEHAEGSSSQALELKPVARSQRPVASWPA